MAKPQAGPMFEFGYLPNETQAAFHVRITDLIEANMEAASVWQRLEDAAADPKQEPDLELMAHRANRLMRQNWPARREAMAGDLATLQRWQAEEKEKLDALQAVDFGPMHAPMAVKLDDGPGYSYDRLTTQCGIPEGDLANIPGTESKPIAMHVTQVTCPACMGETPKGVPVPKLVRKPVRSARRR